MPDQLFSRDLRTATLDVTTTQNLVSFLVSGDLVKFSYEEIRKLSDGTALPARKFSVDRSLSVVDLSAWIATGKDFAEQFRQEDEDAKTAADAAAAKEAVRWAALTPDAQKAEVGAARAARQALIDNAPLSDPTPSGPALVADPVVSVPLTP